MHTVPIKYLHRSNFSL